MLTDFVTSIIQYIEKNLQVESIGAIVFIALIILLVFGLVFLIFRGIRLWYWKVDDQMWELQRINMNLEAIKQTMPECLSGATGVLQEINIQEMPSPTETKTEMTEDIHTEESTEDNREMPQVETIKTGYDVGKTGKIYVEETLREQIQF